MDFESLLDELRSGSLTSRDSKALAVELAGALASGDEENAERAALAAYYASILPEPVAIPFFEELLADPAAEGRERLRGRLWWVRLNRTALSGGDNPSPVTELAESILVNERSPYARQRVLVFLKTWPLRSAIFPFLGSRPLSSVEIPDDGRAIYQLKDEARLAARQAVAKGYAVARSAERAVAAWAAGELGLDDAMATLRVAEPLLAEFPWGALTLAPMAAAALTDTSARPKLRTAIQLYGAWLWARFGEPGPADLFDDEEPNEASSEAPSDGAKPTHPLPASWPTLLDALAAYRDDDPWCDAALLKLEAMLATSPMLAATADDASRPIQASPAPRSPDTMRLALAQALARTSPERYSGPACEQSVTDMLKPALARIAMLGGRALTHEEAEALSSAVGSSSAYRAEAAATALRAMSKAGIDISLALPAMAKALLSSPADSGGLSAGGDLGPGDLSQKAGCDATKAFDDIDLQPAESEGGFMNLDNLTMLLAMCMPASTAHRLAKALEAALSSGALSEADRTLVDLTLRKTAKAGNVAAKAWLKGQA
jgi:hypothetical protein